MSARKCLLNFGLTIFRAFFHGSKTDLYWFIFRYDQRRFGWKLQNPSCTSRQCFVGVTYNHDLHPTVYLLPRNKTFLTNVPMSLFLYLHMLRNDGDAPSLVSKLRGDYNTGAVFFCLGSMMEAGELYFTFTCCGSRTWTRFYQSLISGFLSGRRHISSTTSSLHSSRSYDVFEI
jgi:hypothetical protein